MSRLSSLLLTTLLPVCAGLPAVRADASGPPAAALEAMLQDGLHQPVWNFSLAVVRSATNTSERAQASLLAARAALGMGRPEDGLKQIESARPDLISAGLSSQTLFWEARLFLAQNLPAEASRLLAAAETLPEADPMRVALLRLKARCLLAMGREEDALVFFNMALPSAAAGEDGAEARLDQAALLLRLGREAEAEPILADLSTTGWSTLAATEARVWLGRMRASRREFDAARREVEPVATSTNTLPRVRAQAFEVLSDALEGAGDLTNAVLSVERMEGFLQDPTDLARARVERARLLILSGRVEEGAELLRTHVAAAGLPEGASQSQALVAAAHAAAGRHEAAVQAWQDYLEAFDDPQGLAAAHYGKGVSLQLLNRPAEAATSFAKAADVYTRPDLRRNALLARAESLLAAGTFAQAREIFLSLAGEEGFPGDLRHHALYQAAFALAQTGESLAAEKELEALAGEAPASPGGVRALRQVAALREKRGAWPEAIHAYEQILKSPTVGPEADLARLHLGILHYRQAEYGKALADFEGASATPGEIGERAMFLKAWTLYMMGRNGEGLALAERFLEEHPKSPWADEVLYWIGEVRFNQGDHAAAETVFARLMRDFPDEPAAADAMFWAGRAATMQKQYVRAMEHFSRFVARYPSSPQIPEALFHEADALASLGRFPAAILVFEEIIKNHPRSRLVPAAWGRKGDCCYTLGGADPQRYAEAARAYQLLIESRDTPPDIRWQAEYKLAQTLDRMGDVDSALQHLLAVVYGVSSESGRLDAVIAVWFARAALDAGTMLEAQNRTPEAAAVYRKLAAAGLAASEEASARIRKLQSAKALPQRAPGS